MRATLDAENTLHVLGFLKHFHEQLASPARSAVGSLKLLDGLQANAGDSDWTQVLDSTESNATRHPVYRQVQGKELVL